MIEFSDDDTPSFSDLMSKKREERELEQLIVYLRKKKNDELKHKQSAQKLIMETLIAKIQKKKELDPVQVF